MTLPAKSHWGLMIVRNSEGISAIIAAPRSYATATEYNEDSDYIGIEFKMGVYFQPFRAPTMVNSAEILPAARRTSFWLGSTPVEFPTYEDIELFVKDLRRLSILQDNKIVQQKVSGREPALSPRTVQRHFLQATGLTYKHYQQLTRAQGATDLLKSGMPAIEVAYELGYSDQFHLSRSLKTLTGQTPSQIKLSFE